MKFAFVISLLFFTLTDATAIINDTLALRKKARFRRAIAPEYIPIQFAGNIGWLSSGVGFRNRNDNYQLSVVYGFVPASQSVVRSHLITAKNIFHLFHFPVRDRVTLLPYASIGISWEVGGRSFFWQPENMPPGYYDFPKSVHAIPALGLKYRRDGSKLKPFKGLEVFLEVTSVDAYIWYKFMSDEIEMHQILTLACGIHLLR
jgi:hypothetical protein